MKTAKRNGAITEIKTPELDKMSAARNRSQPIGEFLEWLQTEKRWELAEWHGETLWPIHYSIEKLLAEFCEIDLQKIDNERRAILDSLR